MTNIRERFESALSGGAIEYPVYAVYDWFVKNRPAVDWKKLFSLGLGRINHANLVRHEHPNFKLVKTISEQDGKVCRDVRLITDKGELHEWYLGEWKQEHFIKTPEDYRIMTRALEGVKVVADEKPFLESELKLGDRGITVGQMAGLGSGRTPLMVLQIDWVGLEQFSMDLAYEQREMFEWLEIMNEIKLEEIRQAVKTPVSQIKLWENLSIETVGHVHYRRHFVPLYKKILDITGAANKKIQVHYDGKLKVISEDIGRLGFDGIDSFTEAPEGDMTVCEARGAWPDKFLWINPNLNLYSMPEKELADNIKRIIKSAGTGRFCLMISEDVPQNWQKSVPAVLKCLS
ncbi:MAG: hypothetical protein WC637_00650 [Victivallales bacterium]